MSSSKVFKKSLEEEKILKDRTIRCKDCRNRISFKEKYIKIGKSFICEICMHKKPIIYDSYNSYTLNGLFKKLCL